MLRWLSSLCLSMAVSSCSLPRLARRSCLGFSDSWCGPLRTPTAHWRTASFIIRAAAAPRPRTSRLPRPLQPVTVTALVSWLHSHLSVEGQRLFDLDAMLAAALPFDQHATLLCRTEEVIAKYRHAFGRECQPAVSATLLLQHRQTVQRLLSIAGLDVPLEQVDLKEWTAQVEQLEAVMAEWCRQPALLTVERASVDQARALWKAALATPLVEDEWVHLALAQRSWSQPQHEDDGLHPHSSTAAVADAENSSASSLAHSSGVDFRAASASHSMESLLRLVSCEDVGTKYVVTSCYERLVTDSQPRQHSLLLFFERERVPAGNECDYSDIALSMLARPAPSRKTLPVGCGHRSE